MFRGCTGWFKNLVVDGRKLVLKLRIKGYLYHLPDGSSKKSVWPG